MLDMMDAAESVEMTPFAFDRIFWLIGSGDFFRTTTTDNHGRTKKLYTSRKTRSFLQIMGAPIPA